MITTRTLLAVLIAVFVTACAGIENRPKEAAGTLLGAGLGALAGSQIGGGKGQLAAVAIGALAGAWLGNEAGKSLDKADKLYAQRTTQNVLEHNQSGVAASWRNPDSGHSGSTMPTRSFQSASGQNCREFENTITVDGKSEVATGTACRSSGGTWKFVH